MKFKTIILLISILFFQNINAQKIKFKDENLKIALLELGYDFNKDKEIPQLARAEISTTASATPLARAHKVGQGKTRQQKTEQLLGFLLVIQDIFQDLVKCEIQRLRKQFYWVRPQ